MANGFRQIWLAVVFLSGMASVNTSAAAESGYTAEWGKLVAEAENEGQVNLYVSGYHPIIPAFQKAFPKITVFGVTGRGSQLGPRIMAERRARKYFVDVYVGGSTTIYGYDGSVLG